MGTALLCSPLALLCVAAATPGSAGPAPGHPDSLSSSRLVLAGERVSWTMRVQPTSVLEVLPEADLDGDGWLGASEVRAAAEAIGAYLAAHYRLYPGGETEPLALAPVRCELLSPAVAGWASTGEPWIEVALEGRAQAPLRSFALEVDPFHDTSPEHADVCEIVLDGEAGEAGDAGEAGPAARPGALRVILTAQRPRYEHEPGRAPPSGLAAWMRLGVLHILTGWDHIAFLLALLVAARGLRSLVVVVSAFTVAHSITLALAALDVVTPNELFVELAIALSIAYVGAQSLLAPRRHGLWLEALVFGLVHGLGFAGFLRDALASSQDRLLPLLGFNLGVELGQLALVVAAVLALGAGRRLVARRSRPLRVGEPAAPRGAGERLVPRRLALPASLAVIALGLFWFVERARWLA